MRGIRSWGHTMRCACAVRKVVCFYHTRPFLLSYDWHGHPYLPTRERRQHEAFLRFNDSVASFVPTECPEAGGGGRMGYIRKALFKGYLEYPGLHAEVTT